MRRSTVLSFLSVVLLFGRVVDAQSTAGNTVLPMKLYNGYLIVVHGSIGKFTDRNLVIDTGSYPSVVDRGIARKLHVRGENGELYLIEHNIKTQIVVLPEIRVGPVHGENMRVISQDLTELGERFGTRVDALIGLDVLRASSFRIDYVAKTVTFGPVTAAPYSAPLHWRNAHACVDLSVDGQSTHLLVDTGASRLLLFSSHLPWLRAYSDGLRTFNNLGGSFALKEVRGRRLELAGTNLGFGEVYISDASNMAEFDFDGFLAAGALPFRQVTFDFEQQTFGWEPAPGKADAAHTAGRANRNLGAMSAASSNPSFLTPGLPGTTESCTPDSLPGPGLGCGHPLMRRTK